MPTALDDIISITIKCKGNFNVVEARFNSVIVGQLNYTINSDSTINLFGLWVDSRMRNKGIAKRLNQYLLNRFDEDGKFGVLIAMTTNLYVIKILEAHHFTMVCRMFNKNEMWIKDMT